MYWFIIAPYKSPPFGSCAIYVRYGVIGWKHHLLDPFRASFSFNGFDQDAMQHMDTLTIEHTDMMNLE